jgi:hypothetical protein
LSCKRRQIFEDNTLGGLGELMRREMNKKWKEGLVEE